MTTPVSIDASASASASASAATASPEPADLQLALDIALDSECAVEPDASILNEEQIHRWCLRCLQLQQMLDMSHARRVEISVQLLDRSAMQRLNQQYRDRNTPTNVLSFASDLPVLPVQIHSQASLPAEHGSPELPSGYLALGDIVLCPAVIEREAAEQGKSLEQHWAHMLVHGTLHLCGYDHEQLDDADAMELLEIQILSGLGLPDPYREL